MEIPIQIAVEDPLSESVLRRILRQSGRNFIVGQCYQRGGFGFLKRIVHGFNSAAEGMPYLMLTDLDRYPCPPALISDWLPMPKHHNLLFRVAVHEVESWLLADQDSLAEFLGISKKLISDKPDEIPQPKEELIRLTKKSRNRELRRDIVPPPGSTRKQGPGYNGRLVEFVQKHWSPERASKKSPSLGRTLNVLKAFEPIWDLSR
jgi:hypothetical protein